MQQHLGPSTLTNSGTNRCCYVGRLTQFASSLHHPVPVLGQACLSAILSQQEPCAIVSSITSQVYEYKSAVDVMQVSSRHRVASLQQEYCKGQDTQQHGLEAR